MKLFAGLFFPGLSLVLLSCRCRGLSEEQPKSQVPATSNGTAVVKPGANVTTPSQNHTLPTAVTAGPSNTTASTSTRNTTIITKTTATTANTTPIAKTNATEALPTSSKSPNVTAVTPKALTSANTPTVTASAKAAANLSRSSGFDVGSFIGGIVLTLGLLIIGYIGCRTYHSKRGVQYRTIDEHDAII